MPTFPTISVSTLLFLSFFWILLVPFDASVGMSDNVPEASCTTNDFDQKEAAKLKARLANQKTRGKRFERVQSVSIADGAHKYVLIAAREPGSTELRHFVTSRRGAAYHRNAAEPFVYKLEQSGYEDIVIEGGGRIYLDEGSKKISIFGFSYGFGQADHERSKRVVLADARFKDFDVTVSNEGY
jgi:phosphohistidine phosphatase